MNTLTCATLTAQKCAAGMQASAAAPVDIARKSALTRAVDHVTIERERKHLNPYAAFNQIYINNYI